MASELLAAVVADLPDPPDRQVVEHGPGRFATDCEMVSVSVASGEFDTYGGQGQAGCVVTPVVTFDCYWSRCWPAIDGEGIPDAAEITAAAQLLNVDLASVTTGLLQRWSDRTLFSTMPDCERVALGQVSPVGPSGGMAGFRFLVSVRL
jgi:hypothetical protein